MYADPVDRASSTEEELRQRQIAAARAQTQDNLPVIGCCHFCRERLESSRLFCDADCRDDHERLKRAQRMR